MTQNRHRHNSCVSSFCQSSLAIVFFLAFNSFSHAQNTLEKKILDEMNLFRANPKAYYLKHKSWFGEAPTTQKVFELIPQTPKLVWNDSLFKEAKAAGNSNHLNSGSYTKGFCGFAGFGESSLYKDSVLKEVLRSSFTTFLSPDYTHVGIYTYEVNYSGYVFHSVYVYIGTRCGTAKSIFRFPGEKVIEKIGQVDMKRVNTVSNTKFLDEKEKEMIVEMNIARCHPEVYADIISNYLIDRGMISFNDWLAGQEIVELLKSMKPMGAMRPDERLYQSAKKHGVDQRDRGFTGHTGSDGSSPFDRIKKVLGDDYLEGNENLVGNSSPREAVIALLVDGGIASRGHRLNIINPNWTHVGCYFVGTVGNMPGCYVQNFAKLKR